MVTVELTQGKVAVIDDCDATRVLALKWYASRHGRHWYAMHGRAPKLLLHRLILNAPEGMVVDHIDGDGLNNQRGNLRLATLRENTINSRPRQIFKGVWAQPNGKSVAALTVHGRKVYLGIFGCEQQAACAYDAAARQHFGQFARLNNVMGANDP